jgi:toxin YoeB
LRLVFSSNAWEDYLRWQFEDREILARINALIREALRTPFQGTGKPEPFRNDMAGWWARRITREHRLIYRVSGKGDAQVLEIAACRFHYRA